MAAAPALVPVPAGRGRFRVKLVLPHGPDAHYFYGDSYEEAIGMRDALLSELAGLPFEPGVFVYVETSLGHVRVA